MTGTLESILNGVRSVKNRLSDAVFAAAKTAKRVLAPVKHPLTLTALLATLSPSFAQQNANAEVLLTMEARNLNNFPSRIWAPNRQTLKVFVYADNTSQTEATSGIEWELKAPPQLEYVGLRRPSPYITLSSSEPDSATNDFFYPSSMDSYLNCVNPPEQVNSRFTARINGGPQRAPISHRKGWLGIYYFKVPTNCPLGDYKFEIINPRAECPDGEAQNARGTKMTIRVVPNLNDYYFKSNKRELIQDINQNDVYLHLPGYVVPVNGGRLCIKASSDLQNWTPLATNSFYNAYTYNPLDFIDKNAVTTHEKRFYTVEAISP
jgi:hypothetical protein